MAMYFWTLDIEFTQFIFADPYLARIDPIDHSRASRKYAQYLANLIADEARMNQKQMDLQTIQDKMINKYYVSLLQYTNKNNDGSSLPKGLQVQEIYLIR
jgi:hypothetical protein